MSFDESIAVAINTLAHPRRVRLFRLLSTDPAAGRSFTTLMAASKLNKAPLAHHLEIMERGGLINRQRHGNRVAFVLTPGPLGEAMDDIERFRQPARADHAAESSNPVFAE